MDHVCKFYMKGNCRNGEKCKFIHDKNICRNMFFYNECKFGDECKYKHNITPTKISNYKKKYVKNTESFQPSFAPPDMRMIVESSKQSKYPRIIKSNDLIVINDLFSEYDDKNIYQSLLREVNNSGINNQNLWKLWHGNTHMIADDKKKWKEKCPTFNMIIDKIKTYFNMDIKATRFNWYRDSSEWKPFHHDAAAVKTDKAKTQNLTVGVSFGDEREVAFENVKTKAVISLPLSNGSIYVFSKDVNIEWKHGILQIPHEKRDPTEKGRLSIIAWGWVEMEDK